MILWRILYPKRRIITIHIMCKTFRRTTMWTKPAATEMRFGFEVTMYVMNK
jgi:coenzyme PQQ precursor peptide PqqA